jgi:RecA/RadA recombinase
MKKPALFATLLDGISAYATVASDGKSSSEFGKFFDTGSHTLNAALSGSLFGGMPDNKITVFAGESSTGKTFFVLGILKSWLQQNPTGVIVYFDTESAVTNKMLTERGIDVDRVLKVEPTTIEEFRESAINILDNYDKSKAKDPMIMVLDSLGNLSSRKEVTDIQEHKDSRDMTKAQLIRGAFRVLRLRLARLKVPMIVTNHVYAVVGSYVPQKAMSGGGGLVYVSDSIAMLSKSKDRDADKNIIGSLIKVVMQKSRLSRENTESDVRISYDGGLDRYYGLLDLATEAGLVNNNNGRYTYGKTTMTAKAIAANPTEFFTPEFMKQLDDTYVKPNYTYGTITAAQTETDSDDEE